MDREKRNRPRVVKWVIVALIVIAAIMGWRLIFRRPPFNPDKVARAEAQMWQAYYSDNKTKLGLEMIRLMRNQHGLSLFEAKKISELLASSAMQFRSAKGNYEAVALPDLTQAYQLIKQASGKSFDPEDAARAELAWWIARRTPGQDSQEHVGMKIAKLYAILYDHEPSTFLKAGVLRAEAGKLRDSGGEHADWERVEDLLKKSYRELKTAL